MTAAGRPAALARVLATARSRPLAATLAALALGGSIAVVGVDLDEEGVLRRPPAPAPTRVTTSPAPARAARPATAEGFTEALSVVRPALEACHRAWASSVPTAPDRAVGIARLASRPDGTLGVVDVVLEGEPPGAGGMQVCVQGALGGLSFTPSAGAPGSVRFPLALGEDP